MKITLNHGAAGGRLDRVRPDRPWSRLAAAVLLGIAFTQVAFLGHDVGHKQLFRTRRAATWAACCMPTSPGGLATAAASFVAGLQPDLHRILRVASAAGGAHLPCCCGQPQGSLFRMLRAVAER